jgi:hypothetical protein
MYKVAWMLFVPPSVNHGANDTHRNANLRGRTANSTASEDKVL